MDPERIRQQRLSNRLQSLVLIVGMGLISGLMGWLLFGKLGFAAALIGSLILAVLGPRISPPLVLRMYRARKITRRESSELVEIVNELSRRAKLKRPPEIYYVPSRMLNAFAMGYDSKSYVAVTDGLLRFLRPRELAGVLAHEVSHIRFHDIRVLSAADMFSRVTSFISRIGMFIGLAALFWFLTVGNFSWWLVKGPILFIAPVASVLLQLALSRSREFNADLGAVELTGDPRAMISALQKIHRSSVDGFKRLTFPGRRRVEPALLRTHPPLDQRVERLLELTPQVVEEQEFDPIQVINKRHVAEKIVKPVRKPPRYHLSNGMWY